jgi:hypothetical protein
MKNCCLFSKTVSPLKSPKEVVLDGALKAEIAATTTLATVALCGQIEDGDPLSPVNAISHIVWGDEAYTQRDLSLKYTAIGALLNDISVGSWAFLHEWLFGRAQDEGNIKKSLFGGVLISALAYIIDYHCIPKRLKPGFERHLQPKSLLIIYAVLALTLGLGGKFRR